MAVKQAPAGAGPGWMPFELNEEFTAGWWNDPLHYLYDDERDHHVEARLDGIVVARAELYEAVDCSHYGVPPADRSDLKIHFFDVARSRRRPASCRLS